MGRLRRMLAQPGFAGLLAVLGLAAINWPFLEVARQAGDFVLYAYFFGAWAALILIAALVSRALGRHRPEGDDDV